MISISGRLTDEEMRQIAFTTKEEIDAIAVRIFGPSPLEAGSSVRGVPAPEAPVNWKKEGF